MAGAPTLSCPRGNIGRNCIYGQQGNEILPLGDEVCFRILKINSLGAVILGHCTST